MSFQRAFPDLSVALWSDALRFTLSPWEDEDGFWAGHGFVWTFWIIWKAAVRKVSFITNSTKYKRHSSCLYNACMLVGAQVRGHFELDLLCYCNPPPPPPTPLIGSVAFEWPSVWIEMNFRWGLMRSGIAAPRGHTVNLTLSWSDNRMDQCSS